MLAGSAILLCGTALYGVAKEAGVPPERLAGAVSGVTFRHADVTIKTLDGLHTSNMVWRGQFIADEPMSFMLTTDPGSRIFCGGDFSILGDLRTWGELFSPEVGILAIGGLSARPGQHDRVAHSGCRHRRRMARRLACDSAALPARG